MLVAAVADRGRREAPIRAKSGRGRGAVSDRAYMPLLSSATIASPICAVETTTLPGA